MYTEKSLSEKIIELNSQKYVQAWSVKRELKMLITILEENEEILAITSGYMDGHTVLVTCTNKRIIFLNKNLIIGMNQAQIPLNKIHSVNHSTGIMFGKIVIWNGAISTEIRNVVKESAIIFAKVVNKKIEAEN